MLQTTIDRKLTLLACSGSILATTLFALPSHSSPVNPSTPPQHIATLSLSQEGISTPASYEKRLQQAAFSRFGCGCASCITSIRQLVKSGQIAV